MKSSNGGWLLLVAISVIVDLIKFIVCINSHYTFLHILLIIASLPGQIFPVSPLFPWSSNDLFVCLYIHIYMHIYIHIHRHYLPGTREVQHQCSITDNRIELCTTYCGERATALVRCVPSYSRIQPPNQLLLWDI